MELRFFKDAYRLSDNYASKDGPIGTPRQQKSLAIQSFRADLVLNLLSRSADTKSFSMRKETVSDGEKKILLIVHTRIFLPRFIDFGRMLLDSNEYEVFIHLARKGSFERIEDDKNILVNFGFKLSKSTSDYRPPHSPAPSICRIKKPQGTSTLLVVLSTVSRALRAVNYWLDKRIIFQVLMSARKLYRIVSLLRHEDPQAVVLVDVPTWDTGFYIRGCKILRIPTITILGQGGPLEEAARVCSKSPELVASPILRFLFPKKYGKWVYQLEGNHFTMIPLSAIVAKELFKASMQYPWIECSSNADAVVVENHAYFQQSKKAGLIADNLFVTGLPHHDMYSALEPKTLYNLILNNHGLYERKPVIATSLLPNYNGRTLEGADFTSYEEMLDFWLQIMTELKDFHTIFCLHPTTPKSIQRIIENAGGVISRNTTPEVIAVSHLYVASLSSTLAIAAAFGVPSINYDWCQYNMRHYEQAKGIVTVRSKSDFEQTLKTLVSNSEQYSALAQKALVDKENWGNLDGKTSNRIFDVLNSVLRKYN